MINQYDSIEGLICEGCGTDEDVTIDEDGENICFDCLFEKITKEMFNCGY